MYTYFYGRRACKIALDTSKSDMFITHARAYNKSLFYIITPKLWKVTFVLLIFFFFLFSRAIIVYFLIRSTL